MLYTTVCGTLRILRQGMTTRRKALVVSIPPRLKLRVSCVAPETVPRECAPCGSPSIRHGFGLGAMALGLGRAVTQRLEFGHRDSQSWTTTPAIAPSPTQLVSAPPDHKRGSPVCPKLIPPITELQLPSVAEFWRYSGEQRGPASSGLLQSPRVVKKTV